VKIINKLILKNMTDKKMRKVIDDIVALVGFVLFLTGIIKSNLSTLFAGIYLIHIVRSNNES